MRKDILSVENITMQFGGVVAVNNLSLHIPEGQIVALIGPNGAGKTTAFNCITGVYEPTNGRVDFMGEPIVCNHPRGKMKKSYAGAESERYLSLPTVSYTPDKITKRGIARTFQNIRLFKSMTVFENVLTAMHVRRTSNVFSATFRANHKEEAAQREKALELLKANPDVGVAILDIMLPGIDGFEVCRSIRATDKKIGIIMLTARSQEMDKITGLMTGADDYMTKPFSPAELTARIDALYRRIDSDGSSNQIELKHGPFVLNTRNRTLDKEGRRIKLTQVEYAIVKLFMQNPGRALSREDILAAVWGRDYDGELKIVDVNIRRLRIKIEDDTANPTYITTVWGFGYKWGA